MFRYNYSLPLQVEREVLGGSVTFICPGRGQGGVSGRALATWVWAGRALCRPVLRLCHKIVRMTAAQGVVKVAADDPEPGGHRQG